MVRFLSYACIAGFLITCAPSKDSVQHIDSSSTALRDTSGGQKTMQLFMDADSLPDMPVIGKAQNQKGGAVLVTDTETYWIDGLHSWDANLVDRPVRVWGDIMLRNDNPVFLDTSKLVSQGIPVDSEEELIAQRGRYWIVNARYELVRP